MHKDKILLAVSGGIDSMCMADIYVRRYPCEQLAIAHCNFNLRGDESDGDEALVRGWALSRGVRFHVRSFDTKGFAAGHGVSIEMAARELRYRWFAELCAAEGYTEIAVAHNANDNAETLMLNLLRGSGMKGLSGMSSSSCVPYSDGSPVRLVRPLLDMTRKQIEGYAMTNGVVYRNDSTNFSSEYKRNMLRNEVFPVFERVNPSVVRTLNREMGYFAEANEIVADYCAREIAQIAGHAGNDGARHARHARHARPDRASDGSVRIFYQDLLSRKHWRYLLYHILEPYGFNSAALASVEDLLSSDRTVSGKRFESKDHVLLMERDHMHVVPRVVGQAGNDILRHARPDRASDDVFMPVRGAGTYHVNGRAVKVEVVERSTDMPLKQPEGVLVFDASKLEFPFVLRGWRSGDWLVPLGMKGKKKVSDLFSDLKLDSFMKASAVMIVDVRTEGMAEGQHVAGVLGARIDDRYKVTEHTDRIIRITENTI